MALKYPLVNSKSVTASSFADHLSVQPVIGATEASASCACRYALAPTTQTQNYTLGHDELIFVLQGQMTCALGDRSHDLKPGHCLHVPSGTARRFANTGGDEAVMISYVIDAAGFDQAGFNPETGGSSTAGQIVHLDDVALEEMAKADGWQITDFRLPFGNHNGVASTLFRARFFPGAVHAKHVHENCDEIYTIISGHGLAGAGDDRVEVHAGDFHFIPKGVEHWLHNLSDTDPIEVIGTYIKSGSVAETGYVFKGNVTTHDIAERTDLA